MVRDTWRGEGREEKEPSDKTDKRRAEGLTRTRWGKVTQESTTTKKDGEEVGEVERRSPTGRGGTGVRGGPMTTEGLGAEVDPETSRTRVVCEVRRPRQV